MPCPRALLVVLGAPLLLGLTGFSPPRQERLASDPPALAELLDAVDADSIGADLGFLADDELGGRGTPSPGLRIAARYLCARLARLGLEPAGSPADDGASASGLEAYLARHRWRELRLDPTRTRARLLREGEALPLVFGEDYFFHPGGGFSMGAEGALVWVGRAAEAELEGLELSGCFALVGDVPPGDWAERRARLAARGVRGIVIAPTSPALEASFQRQAESVRSQLDRWQLQTERDDPPLAQLTPRGLERAGLAAPWPAAGSVLGRWREERALSGSAESLVLENVVGLLRGGDPSLAGEVLLLTAHYDHLGAPGGIVHPGADDNASGVAALLAVADALAAHGPPGRSVAFVFFAGEEHGLQGSWAWANDPTLPPGLRPVGVINLDMVGRNAPETLFLTPSREHPHRGPLADTLERLAASEGFRPVADDELWERSDQLPLARVLRLAAVGLSSGEHEDYHLPSDRPEALDLDKVRRVARLVARAVVTLGEAEVGTLPAAARR